MSAHSQARTGTLVFARENARILAFGALHIFFSTPGQTICIGLFIGPFSSAFGLSAGDIGGLYLLATVASAATFLTVGHLIDSVNLRTYSTLSIAGLAIACGLTAIASGAATLGLGLYALRLTGQGLMVHIETTATARAFATNRGLALSLTALGAPLSNALFPAAVAALIAVLGWRGAYGALGVMLLVLVLPLARMLADPDGAGGATAMRGGARGRLWTGLRVLARSRYIWAALPALAIMPFFSTALMFNISTLATARGWSHEVIAVGFSAMAAANIAGLLLSGRLIDRFSARMLFLAHPLPMVACLALLALQGGAWALPVALALSGLSSAITKTTGTAMWAELFGTANLGTMRSFATMYMVLGSAVAPFTFGLLIDYGWSAPQVLGLFAPVALLAAVPVTIAELWPRDRSAS